MRKRQKRRLQRAVVLWNGTAAIVAMMLASQQSLFWLFREHYVYVQGETRIDVQRVGSWPLSVVCSVFAASCTWCTWHRMPRTCRVLGALTGFWTCAYLFLYAGFSPFQGGFVLPTAWWHQSFFWIRVVLDPTYVLGWLLGPMMLVFAMGTWWIGKNTPTHPPTITCSACGYDLRGSLHGSICPECGADV